MSFSFKNRHHFPLFGALLVAFLFVTTYLWRSSGTIYSGTVEVDEYFLGSRSSGRVVEMLVKEGDWVKKGDLIARLDRYQQRLIDYERLVEMLKVNAISQQQVEYAKLELDDQEIRSPIEGQILTKIHDLGEVVAQGSPLVMVGDIAHPWIKIYIPEARINQVSMNQPATIILDGLRSTWKGHVNYICPTAEFTPRSVQTQEDRASQTFAVKIYFDTQPPTLRPGVAADVTLEGH